MLLPTWLRHLRQRWFPARGMGRHALPCPPRRFVLLRLEALEDRLTPATTFNVGPAPADLIAAVRTADHTAGPVVLVLPANTIYTLSQPDNNNAAVEDNNWYGPNALPAIDNDITIQGNGSIIERSASASTAFRLFYVSGGPGLTGGALPAGSLTLISLTLRNGDAQGGNSANGGGGLGAGGAIFNQGTLALNQVTLTGNTAHGGNAGDFTAGYGGGGIGASSPSASENGGGFGGTFAVAGTPSGGMGAAADPGMPSGGGGGAGFDANGNAAPAGGGGGTGGGVSGLGSGTGDGGDGGAGIINNGAGSNGGAFGAGGVSATDGDGGGGGGVGGGGGSGFLPGGGGFGGGGAFGNGGSGAGGGGFGGGGGGNPAGGGGGSAFGGGSGGSGAVGGFGGGGGGAGLGGAVFTMYGSATLTNVTLAGNSAVGGNGGSGNGVQYGYGGNGGSGYGGAVFNLDGSVTIINSTLARNTVTAGAGGAANFASPAGNAGSANGAAVNNLAFGNNLSGAAVTATLTMTNSILAYSTGGADLVSNAINGAGTNTAVVHGSNNLVQSNALFGSTLDAGVITSSADPLLAPLGNYSATGDLPMQTFALKPGSPALNAGLGVGSVAGSGTVPAVDERGAARPQGSGVDLGAFESRGFTLAATAGTPQVTLTGAAFAQALRATVTANDPGGIPGSGVTVNFAVPASGASAVLSTATTTTDAAGNAFVTATANGTGGPYTVTATAATAGVTGTATFTLTNQQAAAFTSAAATSFSAGQTGSFTVSATGFPTPSLGASGALPQGVAFTDNDDGTATLSGTPALGTAGTYVLTFTAANGVGSPATQTFTLSVLSAPAAPSVSATLNLPAAGTVYVNPAFTGAAGTDPDGAGPATAIGYDAFPTIQQGLDAVATGGKVVVAAGSYAGPLSLARPVVLQGAGAGSVAVVGAHAGVGLNVTAAGGVAVSGLTVSGYLAGLLAGSATTYLSLTDVRFTGNTYGSSLAGVGVVRIAGGAGNDTFFVSPLSVDRQGDDPVFYQGVRALTVDGGGGSNRLVVFLNDSNAATTTWVTDSAVARAGAGTTPFLLFYTATGGTFGGGVDVVLGSGNETAVVQSQLPGAPTAVIGTGGNDVFLVAVTAASSYLNLGLFGGTGVNTLIAFDLSGGASAVNQQGGGGGELDLAYAGVSVSRIGYFNVAAVLSNEPLTTVPLAAM